MSQLGYTDISVQGGYIFGQVPFPLLTIHEANQSYSYRLYAYNLMNFLEFVSDRYAAVNFDLHLNGFIFNKLPLIKRFKLREVASAKVLFGGIRDENNPDKNPKQLKFPSDPSTGAPTTFSLNNKPYIELSVGVANIFKFLRIDVVKRVTYLENPDISKLGIRARLRFDF
jgi:hypothetical protein